jgi:hypothetical protein
MTTHKSELDPIGLHYAFQLSTEWSLNPGQIVVSTDEQATVQNTLRFSIRNPTDYPVVNFENPDKLTPESELPPITAGQKWPKPVDRLYLRFPWCAKPPVQCNGMLTTTGYSENVRCEPDELTRARWYTQRMSDAKVGYYWILFPKDKTVSIGAGESIQFVIDGIITFINAGTTTEIYVKPNVAGYDDTEEAVAAVFLTNPPPQVKLGASADNVPAGTDVALRWQTLNAKGCTLSPIDGGEKPVPTQDPIGYIVRTLGTTTYTLKATSPLGLQTPATVTVHVKPVTIRSFQAVPATGVREGDEVKLNWATDSAVTCEILPDVGFVCSDARGCNTGQRGVRPAIYTEYTLTASGQSLPQKRSLTVFPLRVGWSQTTGNAPWNAIARPVTLLFAPGDDPPAMWLFAPGTGTLNNPVFWSRNGAVWTTATNKAPFSIRGNSGGAVFKGKMWLLGGQDNSGKLNDVWSTADGSAWERVNPTGIIWSPRAGFGCIFFKDKLWVLGGIGAAGQLLRDIWSTVDGAAWVQAGNAPWSPRGEFGIVVFQDRLWILGGRVEGGAGVTKEVWSSLDGVKWTQEDDGAWQPRSNPGVQAIRDRIYVCGGTSASGAGMSSFYYLQNGVWTSTQGPPWKTDRTNLSSIQYQDALWMLGGRLDSGPINQQVWVYAPILT